MEAPSSHLTRLWEERLFLQNTDQIKIESFYLEVTAVQTYKRTDLVKKNVYDIKQWNFSFLNDVFQIYLVTFF